MNPSGLLLASRKIHYAWVIVLVAATMWTITTSIRFATSMLVPHLEDPQGFGWSYGAIGLAFTLQWIFSGLLGPPAGWLADRYGIRRVILLGVALFVAGMVLTGTMTHLWQFYLYFGVILAASLAIFQAPLVAAVSIWFKTNLGLAMGALQAIQGLGTALAILLVALLVSYLGLRWTFWLPGMAGGAVLLLLLRLLHNEPGDIGLRPFGASADEPVQRTQNSEVSRARTRVFLRQVRRTSAFWNLVGIHFWGCAGHNIILLFLVAMAMERGLSQSTAAAVYITLTVVSAITRFAVPVLADRLGSKIVMGVSFCLQTFPVLILLVAQDPWSFYLFAAIFGIGLGGEMTAFPIINRQYYGDAPIGATYGWQMLGAGIGMALGPAAGGLLWDITGDYVGTVLLSLLLSLIGMISIVALPGTSHHQIPQWEEALPPEVRASV